MKFSLSLFIISLLSTTTFASEIDNILNQMKQNEQEKYKSENKKVEKNTHVYRDFLADTNDLSKIYLSYIARLQEYKFSEDTPTEINLSTLGHGINLKYLAWFNYRWGVESSFTYFFYKYADIKASVSPNNVSGKELQASIFLLRKLSYEYDDPHDDLIPYGLYLKLGSTFSDDKVSSTTPIQITSRKVIYASIGLEYFYALTKKYNSLIYLGVEKSIKYNESETETGYLNSHYRFIFENSYEFKFRKDSSISIGYYGEMLNTSFDDTKSRGVINAQIKTIYHSGKISYIF